MRIVAVPLSYLFWASCVLIVILWTPLVAAALLVTHRSDPNRDRVGRLQRHSASLAAHINPFWDFRAVNGDRCIPPRRSRTCSSPTTSRSPTSSSCACCRGR